MSPTMSPGTNAANGADEDEEEQVRLVRRAELRVDVGEDLGTSPSRDIEKNTRDWPISMTRITDVKPTRIATVTSLASQP